MSRLYSSIEAKYFELEKTFGAHNYNPLPVVLKRGLGLFLWDLNDKKYFDYKASVDDFKQGWKEMEFLSDYIKQQDDYIKAQEKAGAGEPFDYVVPIFVIEALKFYEEIILKKL